MSEDIAKRWPAVIAGIVFVLGATLFTRLVDITPEVDGNFFFGPDDPAYKESQEIAELFPVAPQLIFGIKGPIGSLEYLDKMEAFSNALAELDGVASVQSMSRGPGTLEAAKDSPMWRRLLLSDSQTSTLAVAVLKADSHGPDLIHSVEDLVAQHTHPRFEIMISGTPYIVELVRRNLLFDLKVFSSSAILLFSALIAWLFRSLAATVGIVLTGLASAMITLAVMDMTGLPVGILTANLAIMVFVLALSHTIFLSGNYVSALKGEDPSPLRRAILRTLEASSWCMLTTLLGFISLIFVPATPLSQLGIAGSIGTVVAILCAYVFYPWFLMAASPSGLSAPKANLPKMLTDLPHKVGRKGALALLGGLALLALAIPGLNTDPNLAQFFSQGGEAHRGLTFIDRNGGSNPLLLVVEARDGGELDNGDAYDAMWSLQNDLAENDHIGSIISLPVLLAEANSRPLSVLLTWDWIVDILRSDIAGGIGKSFISEDRKKALFLLRMNETERTQNRTTIVGDIEQIADETPLKISLTGGLFKLQGALSPLVRESLIYGLSALVALFFFIALAASGNLAIAAVMTASLALLPAGVLGGAALLGVPLDIIAAPAPNVAIGMAADAMLHLAIAARLTRKGGKPSDWSKALADQSGAIIVTTGVVGFGFMIFLLSDFPPTQRFGALVAAGCVLAASFALIALPQLSPQLEGNQK